MAESGNGSAIEHNSEHKIEKDLERIPVVRPGIVSLVCCFVIKHFYPKTQ